MAAAVMLLVGASEVHWALTATPGVPRPGTTAYLRLVEGSMAGWAPAGTRPNAADAWEVLGESGAIAEAVKTDFATRLSAPGPTWPSDVQWPFDLWVFDRSFPSGEAVTPAQLDLVRRRAADAAQAMRDVGYLQTMDRLLTARWKAMPSELTAVSADQPLFLVYCPEMSDVLSFSYRGGLLMQHAAAEGDEDGFVRLFSQSMACAAGVSRHPSYAAQYHAWDLFDRSADAVVDAIGDARLSPGTCERLLAALDRFCLAPATLGVEGDRLAYHDLIDRIYTDNGRGDGRFLLTEAKRLLSPLAMGGCMPRAAPYASAPDARLANIAASLFPSKREALARADGFFDRWVGALGASGSERESLAAALAEEMAGLDWRWEALRLFGEDAAHRVRATGIAEEDRAALRIMLAIEVYRGRTGEPPASLDELAPILGPGPRNRIDQVFRYRVLGPDDGSPLILTTERGQTCRVFGGYLLEGQGAPGASGARNVVPVDGDDVGDGVGVEEIGAVGIGGLCGGC